MVSPYSKSGMRKCIIIDFTRPRMNPIQSGITVMALLCCCAGIEGKDRSAAEPRSKVRVKSYIHLCKCIVHHSSSVTEPQTIGIADGPTHRRSTEDALCGRMEHKQSLVHNYAIFRCHLNNNSSTSSLSSSALAVASSAQCRHHSETNLLWPQSQIPTWAWDGE